MRIGEIEADVRRSNPETRIIRAVHRQVGFSDLDGNEVALPGTERVAAFAAIARPDAFERTLTDMNLAISDRCWWPDHHAYDGTDADDICRWIDEGRFGAVVTTEKDAVKLSRMDVDWPANLVTLRVEMELLGDGDTMLGEAVTEVLETHARQPEDEPQADDSV